MKGATSVKQVAGDIDRRGRLLSERLRDGDNRRMNISMTEFKRRCLELIRRVEATGERITITRRGKVMAQLAPPAVLSASAMKPWERLRGRARWLAEPGERFISGEDIGTPRRKV